MQNKVNAGTMGRGKLLLSLRVRELYCGKFGKVVQNRVNAGTPGKRNAGGEPEGEGDLLRKV